MWIKEFEDGLLVTNESLDTNQYDQLLVDVDAIVNQLAEGETND